MAKKEVKKSWLTKELCDKIIATINYIPVPVMALGGIWGFDISVYCAAGCAMLASIVEFVKLFVKE